MKEGVNKHGDCNHFAIGKHGTGSRLRQAPCWRSKAWYAVSTSTYQVVKISSQLASVIKSVGCPQGAIIVSSPSLVSAP